MTIALDTPTVSAILAAVAAEPGELTPDDVATELGLPVPRVRLVCQWLRQAHVLAPSTWRILPHVPAYIERKGGLREAVSGDDRHAEVLSVLVGIGPLNGPALSAALGVPALTGTHKRALDDLAAYGLLSTPSHLWPQEPPCPNA